jgi:hypothetical protein
MTPASSACVPAFESVPAFSTTGTFTLLFNGLKTGPISSHPPVSETKDTLTIPTPSINSD